MLPRLAIIVLCALSWNVKGEDSDSEYYYDEDYDDKGYRNKIVGGLVVEISKAPYQVSLEWKTKGQKYRHRCGGSIISKDWVITAAHCVIGIKKERFRIRAGTTFKQNGGTLHNIKQYKIHNDYVKSKKDFDVALMQVSEPFEFSGKIKAIELAADEPAFGSKAWVSGWGHTSYNGAPSAKLKVVELRITNRAVCSAIYNWTITPRMICAFTIEGGKDSCQGDSGGPLVVDNKLVGIVSWGKRCGEPRVPGVYTNLKVFKIWIEQFIGSSVKIWNAQHFIKLYLEKRKGKSSVDEHPTSGRYGVQNGRSTLAQQTPNQGSPDKIRNAQSFMTHWLEMRKGKS